MDKDLIDLLAACKGEEIGASRRDELLARLRDDEALQDSLVAELRMLGMLKAVQATEPRWLLLHERLGWIPAKPPLTVAAEDAFLRRVDGLGPSRWPRGVITAAAAATVLLIGLGLGLGLGLKGARLRSVPSSGNHSTATASAGPGRMAELNEGGLAMVIKLDQAVWDAGAESPGVGSVLPAGKLRLRSGRATIGFLNGVVLVAEGPADFDLIAMDRVFCHRGRLRTRVPSGARDSSSDRPGRR